VKERFTPMTGELHRYVAAHNSFRDPLTDRVGSAAEGLGLSFMQIGDDQAALITILVRAIGARRALEIGTFLGLGAIAIARGLGPDGRLTCCELDPERAALAGEHLAAAGLADRVEIVVGPALDSVRSMPLEQSLDFSFIDADKASQPQYYEEVLRRTRPGGLIMLDNTLYEGEVLDPEPDGNSGVLAALNDAIAADRRVDSGMLGMADGITLALKR
jgi:caffeoyl-CoA O-methyltransferase